MGASWLRSCRTCIESNFVRPFNLNDLGIVNDDLD